MAKGGSSAPAPDPQIGEAALKQAQTGEDWLNFAKDAFQVSTGRQAELDALTKDVTQRQLGLAEQQQKYTQDVTDRSLSLADKQQKTSDAITKQQLEQSDYAFGLAQQDRQRYESTFQPRENQYLSAVDRYDPLAGQRQRDAISDQITKQQLSAADKSMSAADIEAQRQGQVYRPAEDQYLHDASRYDPNSRQGERDALNNRLIQQQLGEADRFSAAADRDDARYRQTYLPAEDRYQAAAQAFDPNSRQAERDALNNRLIQQQIGEADRYTEAGANDRALYEKSFQPIEQQIADEARNYATPARQAEAAAQAKAEVQAASAAQRASTQRQAASMGINPASGRFQGIERSADVSTALGAADASNKARQQIRDEGYQRQVAAANIGRGLASQGMQYTQIGLGAGAQAGAMGAAAEQEKRAGELSALEQKAAAAARGDTVAARAMQERQLGLAAGAQAGATGSAAEQEKRAGELSALEQKAAAAARGDVAAQREMQQRQLGLGAGQSANATSAASQQERQAAELRGIGLQADAANFGRGLPAQSAASSSLGLQGSSSAAAIGLSGAQLGLGAYGNAIGNMGNAAQLGINSAGLGLSGAQAANAQYLASTDLMGGGFKGAMAGYGGQASTLNQQYGNQVQAWSAEQQANAASSAGIGSALGGLFGLFMSDEDAKTDKKQIPEGAALEAVDAMPVEEWTYKPGVADEGRHVGTYAQDFQRETGKGDGHTIPVQDAIGITMAAVKDLNAKVDKVATAIGLGSRPRKPAKAPGNSNAAIGLGVAA